MKSDPGGASQESIDTRTPCVRSFIASSKRATPSQSAPAFSAANPTSTKPCPYASALTTAINAVPERFFSRLMLKLKRSRSIRASALISSAQQSPWQKLCQHHEIAISALQHRLLDLLSPRGTKRQAFRFQD